MKEHALAAQKESSGLGDAVCRLFKIGRPHADTVPGMATIKQLSNDGEGEDLDACFVLAVAYGFPLAPDSQPETEDPALNRRILLRLALKERYAPALHDLGRLATAGGRPVTDEEKKEYACEYNVSPTSLVQRSMESGYVPAKVYYASLLFTGDHHIEKDSQRAIVLYQEAVEQGSVVAMHKLALAYLDGEGVEKDEDRAKQLLKQASSLGYFASGRKLATLG